MNGRMRAVNCFYNLSGASGTGDITGDVTGKAGVGVGVSGSVWHRHKNEFEKSPKRTTRGGVAATAKGIVRFSLKLQERGFL